MSDHWSSPDGCHPDCPACAAEEKQAGVEAQPESQFGEYHHFCNCPECAAGHKERCDEAWKHRLASDMNLVLREGESKFPYPSNAMTKLCEILDRVADFEGLEYKEPTCATGN